MFPVMEKELYQRFIDTRKDGKKIKGWWFNMQVKQIMSVKYPEYILSLSQSQNFFIKKFFFIKK